MLCSLLSLVHYLFSTAGNMFSVKHQRLNQESTTLATATKTSTSSRGQPHDPTQAVGDDIFALVATYATSKELCRLGCVGRRFRHIIRNEHLWELRALDILPRAQMQAAKAALGLSTYRYLVEAFTRVGIPHGILGFWRADLPSTREPPAPRERPYAVPQVEHIFQPAVMGGSNGQNAQHANGDADLLRISFSGGGILCESISPSGARRGVFTIRISVVRQRVKIGYFCLEDAAVSPTAATFSSRRSVGAGWIPGQTIAEAFMASTVPLPLPQERAPPIWASGSDSFCLARVGGRVSRFTKLRSPHPSSDSDIQAPNPNQPLAEKVALDLCGLWCAPYGSHGLEIIQFSVNAPAGMSAAGAAAVETRPGLMETNNQEYVLGRGGRTGGARGKGGRGGGSTRPVSQKTGSSSGSVCTSRPATDTDVEDDVDDSNNSQASDDSSEGFADFLGTTDKEAQGLEADAAAGAGGGAKIGEVDESHNASAAATEEARERCSSNATLNGQENDIAGIDEDFDDDELSGTYQHPQLFGVKVTGDANVPAGKVSFAVDLDKVCDIDEELEADNRPVILFTPSGAVMANLSNRRSSMGFWRKARGQVNRKPGQWCPEWVDVDFVAYQPGARCAFSVVFRQPSEAVRVIIDFERLLGFKEEWPQWLNFSSGISCNLG